ncbi:Trk system potassium transporter TrkA [Rhodohalobacter sp. SW132]|uniref:Trk system potassium transporter TrkA n=1 Tax=Rhodohalobacter sp. SW132 TaxID=2293433 RepID=UPI000E249E2D|nr:Trk system potassium transporter TrkA [Rhodohalobacter sp. SW132]REL33135.1 Trk system potassium transporter TrkA [Rhodohalobacter sp. SW132]
MKILIAGAGEVGFELSKILSEEQHDVTVLDQRQRCLQRVIENLDVLTVQGNATSPHALVDAGAKQADMMVAVTSVDEVNIIASMMAKRLGVKRVIARVRNDELSRKDAPIPPSELGIDVLIHPEESAANEIFQLVKRASASDVVPLAENRLQMIGLRVESQSEIANKTLVEVASILENIDFRVVAISRRGSTIIPRGNNRLVPLDHVFLITRTEHVKKLVMLTGHDDIKLRKVMIAGGSEVGRLLAKKLSADQKRWQVKLIEPDKELASSIAGAQREILVLNGDPTDPNLLVIEGVQEMDAFISVTEDEESNIISCLMAKHLEVQKTVALVSKSQYVPLSQTIGIDAIVNVKASASDEIHRQIRQGMMLTVKALTGIKAEVIEVIAGENCQILNTPIHSMKIPDGIVIGGIVSGDNVEVATGSSVIRKDDRVIIFALPKAIKEVEKIF